MIKLTPKFWDGSGLMNLHLANVKFDLASKYENQALCVKSVKKRKILQKKSNKYRMQAMSLISYVKIQNV